jgi:hypothetical protein
MSETASARDVLQHLLQGISDRRWPELHELYAEDAVVEYPIALPAPARLDGRGAIQSYRDYHNHLVLADVTGRLPDLIAAFTEQKPSHSGNLSLLSDLSAN